MSIDKIHSLFGNDACIKEIVCQAQLWKDGASYSGYVHQKRPYFGISFVGSGSIEYISGDECIVAKTGDVVFLPKGCFYNTVFRTNNNSVTNYLINFNIDGYTNIKSPTIFLNDGKLTLLPEFKYAVQLYNSSIKGSVSLKSQVYKLVDTILSYKFSDDENGNAIEMCIHYIKNNINADINISSLSKLCKMSESTFRRNFKTHTGMSPLKFINLLKIQKAKEFLENPEFNISIIPEVVGFYDTAHFYKCFISVEGSTPAEYRKKFS